MSELSRKATLQKQLVASGKIKPEEIEVILKQAWMDLCLSQGLTLKDFSTCRALVDACVGKLPSEFQSKLGEWILADLAEAIDQQEQNNVRLFSRRFLSALDCESTRKSLRQSVAAMEVAGASLLLNYMERALTKLLDVLISGSDDVDREYLESLRDGERLFDCACRIPSLVATTTNVTTSNADLDEQIQRLMDLTMRLMIQVGHRDVHLLRSAGLAFHNLNALRTSPESIQQMLFSENKTYPSSVVQSALLLGALSCSTANNEEVDSNAVLSKLLNAIESCLAMVNSSTLEGSPQPQATGKEEKFEKATIACEALCAWCTRAKSCRSCTYDLVLKAIKLVLMFMDHRDPSIGSVCSNAFERLVETSMRIENGDQVLSQVFVEQMTSVASVDFASARRGLYPMMSRLVVALGASRVESLCPGFVSTVLNSAFRAGELSSNRPELGNGICNLVVCYIKTSLAQTEYKVTKQVKQELGLISDVFKRGPSNLFASYFVSRHLLSDLLGEARSVRENDSVREMAKVLLNSLQSISLSTSLSSLNNNNVNNKKKRTLEESHAETIRPSPVKSKEEEEDQVRLVVDTMSQEDQDILLWARLSVMLAFERGGNHVVPVDDSLSFQHSSTSEDGGGEAKKKRKKRQLPEFYVESSQLQRAMIHERSDVREVSWALLSTRVKRTRFPEPILSRLASQSLPLIMKHDGSSLRPSIIRFIDRIAFCLESGGSSEEDEEESRRCAMEAISSFAATCAKSIYPGSPFERLSLALDLSSALMRSFAKSETGYAQLIAPLLFDAGTVHSLIDTLKSPFDSARMQAYEVLECIPAPLPGLESSEKIYELLDKYGWRDRLWAHMRRDADSAGLFMRLLHGKYVVELGWKLDLFVQQDNKSEATSNVESKLDEEIQANRDSYYMRLAIEEARKCITVSTAYDVGCVIVPLDYSRVLATGFSRELPGNTHAEECALRKLGGDNHVNEDDAAGGNAEGTVLYTTMEPCSLRLSGNRPCASRVVSARVARVVVGIKEPDTFVQDCQGWRQCQDNGIQVLSVPDEQVLAECAVLAKNDHTIQPGFEHAKQMNFTKGILSQKLNPSLATSYSLNRLVDLLERDTVRLELSKNQDEEIPVHGIIMALKYIMRDSFTCSKSAAFSLDDLKWVLSVLERTLTVGVNMLMEIESKERQQVLATVMDDEDFITKTTTWLLVREGSELLSETLEAVLHTGASSSSRNPQQKQRRQQQQSKKQVAMSENEKRGNDADMEERIQVVNSNSGWFLKTVLRLRHLGAMTYVAKGLERVTKLLLQNDDSNLQRIPTLVFVPELFSKLGLDEHDKALRRTEGFALAFRAIARSAQFSNRVDVIHSIVDELLRVANASVKEEEQHKTLVACLNVLSVIFDDAVLGKSVIPFVAPAIELAVNGFSHSIWAVRNSSLNVFVTVIKRSVGEPDQASFLESSQTQSKSHSTTAKLFFKTHPRLFPFLSRELNDAIQSVGAKQDRPSLHPVLLFLSSLRRSPIASSTTQSDSDGEDDPALHFVPMLEHLGLMHPNYIIRSLAARALLVLTPPDKIPLEKLIQVVAGGSMDSSSTSSHLENARHGALLQLKLWLGNASCTFAGSTQQKDDELQLMLSIQSTLINFLQDPLNVFLSKQVALECLEALWMSIAKRQGGEDTSGSDNVVQMSSFLSKLNLYQSLFEKWIANCSANESDGPNIGRKRFQVSVIHGLVRYARQMEAWDFVASSIKSILAPCACEALVNLLSKNVNLSLAPEHASLLLDALFNVLPQLPRDQVHLCVDAIFVVLSQAKSPQLATKERLEAISSLVTANNKDDNALMVVSSLKTRGACIQVLGVCHKQLPHSLFYDLLEENSQPHCPLELRLSCAKSLAEGCLQQQHLHNHNHYDDDINVRPWVCALRLLQDADLEVCEHARIAVAREMSINEKKNCSCLEPILRGAFELVTNRFASSQIWFDQLVEWIFFVDDHQIANYAKSDSEQDQEEGELLFKADRDNDFMEPTLFAELAGREMRRVISIQIQQQENYFKTVLVDLAKRASLNVQNCFYVLLLNDLKSVAEVGFSSFEAQQTLHVKLFCALVAVEIFGNSLDVDMLRNLIRIRSQFANKLSFGLKEQLSKCERRFLC